MLYRVYIIYSERYDLYYIGQTNDLSQRLIRHNGGFESYTKKFRPWRLVCSIEKSTRSEAMVLERKLKNLSRKRLSLFIRKYAGPDDHQP